jgi:hypothetical protein
MITIEQLKLGVKNHIWMLKNKKFPDPEEAARLTALLSKEVLNLRLLLDSKQRIGEAKKRGEAPPGWVFEQLKASKEYLATPKLWDKNFEGPLDPDLVSGPSA